MGASSSLTWLVAPETQGTWGLQQETRNLGRSLGGMTGEPRRMEVTGSGLTSILSKVVAVYVVQGVEQAGAGGWEGVAGERSGHLLRRKQAMAASISNQRRVCSAT
jgi:hypothetical protein